MNIDNAKLKEIYCSAKVIARDERFYEIPGAQDYAFSSYCRLLQRTHKFYYKVVPLRYGKTWQEYEIKFDNEPSKIKISINKLAAMVFFPNVKGGFLYPFYDGWRWMKWKVENLHLFVDFKPQMAEAILATIERREPNYAEELKHHQFVNRMDLNKKEKLNEKLKITYNGMRSRAINLKLKKRQPRYSNTQICNQWLNNPDSFKQWYLDHQYYYPEELQLDKDILGFGEANIYAPEYCCLVPRFINEIFTSSQSELKYAITKYQNNNGTVRYCIAPNAFDGGKTHSFTNYIEALQTGRKLKADYIRKVVCNERRSGYIPNYILDTMLLWAQLCEVGRVAMWEPSVETIKREVSNSGKETLHNL